MARPVRSRSADQGGEFGDLIALVRYLVPGDYDPALGAAAPSRYGRGPAPRTLLPADGAVTRPVSGVVKWRRTQDNRLVLKHLKFLVLLDLGTPSAAGPQLSATLCSRPEQPSVISGYLGPCRIQII